MYASKNAHKFMVILKAYFKSQTRRDDLMSYFYMLLEFLGEQLPWRTEAKSDFESTMRAKSDFSKNLSKSLKSQLCQAPEIAKIHDLIQACKFDERPDYLAIKNQLKNLLSKCIHH